MPDDHVYEIFPQSLAGFETRMPATENHCEIGTSALHHAADLDGIEDHRTGEQGHAEAETVFGFLQDARAIVAIECAVDNLRFETCFPERARQAQQSERSSQNLSGIRRDGKDDPLLARDPDNSGSERNLQNPHLTQTFVSCKFFI